MMSGYGSSSGGGRPRKFRKTAAGARAYAVGSPYVISRRRQARAYRGMVTQVPRGVYRFVRCTAATGGHSQDLTFSVTQGTNTYGCLNFMLSHCPSYTDFTNLYDQYRIKSLVFIAQSNWDSADDAVGTSTHLDSANIYLHTVVDTNDDTNPTLDTMRQYPSYKMNRITDLNGMKGRQWIKPQIRLATDGSGGVSVNPSNAWISTESYDTTHYALKWAVTRPAGSRPIVDMTITWYYKATIECRNVK